MGMVISFTTCSDENIEKLLANPPLVWKVVAPDDPDIYEEERSRRKPGFFGRLFGSRPKAGLPDEDTGFSLSETEGAETDLDKSWHGIHYLLTGTAWEGEPPLNFIVAGGVEIGDVEVGYGPARALSSTEIQSLVEALAPIDQAHLRERFNPEEMQKLDIYPNIWDRDPSEDDTLGYCLEYFDEMKKFLNEAARNRLGVVICMQ